MIGAREETDTSRREGEVERVGGRKRKREGGGKSGKGREGGGSRRGKKEVEYM